MPWLAAHLRQVVVARTGPPMPKAALVAGLGELIKRAFLSPASAAGA
jgi:hypothetical protein